MTRRSGLILSALLAAQAVVYYGLSHKDFVPVTRAWEEFPQTIGQWQMVERASMSPETLAELEPDESIERVYIDPAKPSGSRINALVLYYSTQRRGRLPHSPMSCLPGAGWTEVSGRHLSLPGDGDPPLQVSRHLVRKGAVTAVVFFWFQTPRGSAPTLHQAQWLSIPGLLLRGRSDISLVRIAAFGDEATAEADALSFLRDVRPQLASWQGL